MRHGPQLTRSLIEIGIPLLELSHEVTPFVPELPRRHGHAYVAAIRDLTRVERVLAMPSLVENARKVGFDRNHWQAALTKPVQLRVVSIAVCQSKQDTARKQSLTPESNQALGI